MKELMIDDIDVEAFESPLTHNDVIRIAWSGSSGWGEYVIRKGNSGKWFADSECMDSEDNKDFIKALLAKFVDDLIVDG